MALAKAARPIVGRKAKGVNVHIFTSITANYIPKARVLVASLKKHHPECMFHLVLSDDLPPGVDLSKEKFDSVITAEDLNIPDFRSWVFRHSVVELCTAVKGFAFREIMNRHQAEEVIYLDPDIAVLARLDELLVHLDKASILLTPHLTEPEKTLSGIWDNEICALKHGVFNLGFCAVRASSEGRRFVDWWASRLYDFCYDDIPAGLFTDQRWIDLAPCFFKELMILREPAYNVSSWNLTNREITGDFESGFRANGQKICFYHFSGFDSGAIDVALRPFIGKYPALKDLKDWYIDELGKAGQDSLGNIRCKYDFFDNGDPILKIHRVLYRCRPDLIERFRDPYSLQGEGSSYYDWLKANTNMIVDEAGLESREALLSALAAAQRELTTIKGSITWRVNAFIYNILKPFRRKGIV